MKLVVGLGNPGIDYAGTRHNVGFDVVSLLAEKLGWVRSGEFDRVAKSSFDGLAYTGVLNKSSGENEKLLLLKPLTYMNVSGRSVAAAIGFYKLTLEDLIVVVDELALPCGSIRLRGEGSDGGHNGLKDIRRALGSEKYARLRVGIDAPPPPMAGRDYVLGKYTPAQKPLMEQSIARAAGCIVTWADKGLSAAMNAFNASSEPVK